MEQMTRRQFMRVTSIGVCGVAAQLYWARLAFSGNPVPTNMQTAAYANAKAGSVFDQAEAETRRILDEMQAKLQNELAETPEPFSDSLRMKFINMAMWPPVAPIAQDFLTFLGDSETARTWLAFLMPMVEWMSEPFLFPVETGGTPQEQTREVDKIFKRMAELRKQGFTATLDNVGDASLSPEDASAYQNYYATLIRAFLDSGKGDELYLSVKLSALVHNLDAALGSDATARAKQQEIVTAITDLLTMGANAPDKNLFLRIDMEEYCYKDLTLQLFREIVEEHPSIAVDAKGGLRLGVVIQAYLRDSAPDVRELVEWARHQGVRAPIRLVKGAYLEHERTVAAEKGAPSPVWDNKPSTDANFEAVSAYMLLNLDAVLPAFATHNIRSQAHAIALTEAYGLPSDVARIQMLYGMGDPIKRVVASMDRPLREYIPAGSLARGLKYAGRRFEELSNSDNALAKTMRGDFSGVDGSAPTFVGEQDLQYAEKVQEILEQAVAQS